MNVLPERLLDQGAYRHYPFLVSFGPPDPDAPFRQVYITNINVDQLRDSDTGIQEQQYDCHITAAKAIRITAQGK